MGLKSDLDTYLDSWGKLSSLGKVASGTTLLLGCMSIASISSAVYQVKGFFAVALEYYRLCTGFVAGLFIPIPFVSVTQTEIDLIILLGLLLNATHRFSSAHLEIIQLHSFISVGFPSFIVLAAIILPTAATIFVFAMFFVSITIFIFTGGFLTVVAPAHFFSQFAMHLLAPLLLFSVLAAIAEGLARPL